jgi:calpain-15
MNIRNPWGKFEWDGAWADNSEEWTEEMIEIFKPVFDTNDGGFWMSFDDFVQKFVGAAICMIRPW